MNREPRPLTVVVGSGGVGKTTLAAAMGLHAASRGHRTLVMTFDPSLRLKDALGVDDRAREKPVRVQTDTRGELWASLLDARHTFDRIVTDYAPDEATRERILGNRFYDHLRGRLAGILEYMAVERLFEVWNEGGYDRVILDTPPTREAIHFLEAPQRIVSFLDSGALGIARRDWFDEDGRLRTTSRLGPLGRGVEALLDRLVGMGLLRDMSEFFQAFGPLYDGFRSRATDVRELLKSDRTGFVLVSGPGEERIPDTMFFARKLQESGHHLGPVIVNRVNPRLDPPGSQFRAQSDLKRRAHDLLYWLGERDYRGWCELQSLLPERSLIRMPLLGRAPTGLVSLLELGEQIDEGVSRAPDSASPQ